MNSLQKRLLIIGGGILVLLIILVTIIRGFTTRQQAQIGTSSLSPTPIEVGGPKFLSTQEKRQIATQMNKDYFKFSASEAASLRQLCNYRSENFDISCSIMLNQNFVSKKTDKAEEEFRKLLADRGLLDLYENNPSLFILTDLDVNTQLNQSEENFLEVVDEEIPPESPDNQTPTGSNQGGNSQGGSNQNNQNVKSNTDLKLLVDLMQTLLSFDLGNPTDNQGGSGGGGGGGGDNEQTPEISYPPNLGQPNSLNYYQMPVGVGNWVFSSPSCRGHHWGSRTMIGVLYTVANRWKELNPNSRLRIGDINAGSGHLSHKNGVDVDITTTDSTGGYVSAGVEKNVQLGKLFIDTGAIELIIFGDDPPPSVAVTVGNQLNQYAASKGLSYRTAHYDGHNSHFHVRLLPKYRLSTFLPGC